jgi:lipopolysaccharide transport system permease protein
MDIRDFRALMNLFAPLTSIWTHRKLVGRLTGRDIAARYKGSLLGVLWAVIIPLVMLAVYTFVFSVVFQARWGTAGSDRFHFALMLFAGLVVFNVFADCVSRAPCLIVSNVSYVKKVVFPLEILPWVSLGTALFNAGINVLVLMVFALIVGNGIPTTVVLLPIVLIPFLLLVVGISFFLASLGVFVRDLQQVIGVFLTCCMFLSPIFYPLESLPERLRAIVGLSPVSMAVSAARDVLLQGVMPSVTLWFVSTGIGLLVAVLGSVWFAKTRKGFADVM